MTTIDGWTEPGFQGVRAAFESNFESGEVGAAFSAYHRGKLVADLWGGIADETTGRPWSEDSLMPVFSTTKAWTAMAANRLIEAGELDPAERVVEYWPEFAPDSNSTKATTTVEHLLTHQAGLAWCDTELTIEEVAAWDPVIEALEAQQPSWEPGTRHGYHALTYGWLVGEIIKRVSGRTVGTYVADQIAKPLELDLWIGAPESVEARIGRFAGEGGVLDATSLDPAIAEMLSPFLGDDGVLVKALGAGVGAFEDPGVWDSRLVHGAEIPAANGVCDARSLARIYAATIDEVDGFRVLGHAQLGDATTQRTSGPNSILLDMDIQFGLGFMVRSSIIPIGGPRSFGHFGAGGSMGWADPDAQLAFGYVMNKMELGLAGDERTNRLTGACYEAIA